MSRVYSKELLGGILFVVVGTFVCLYSYTYLEMGVALRMGPGYFPFLLGLLLIGLGAIIALSGVLMETSEISYVPLRAIALIAAAPVAFALTVDGLGLLPSTVIACLVSSFASREIPLRKRLLMALILTAICVLVFYAGLQISVPLLGTWLN
jgi:Tripartite tricarboxylate transporter TctB family